MRPENGRGHSEIAVVKTFRIRPSDWAEIERVAAQWQIDTTVFVRRLILLGLEVARERTPDPAQPSMF